MWNASACHTLPLTGPDSVKAGSLGRPRFQSVDITNPIVIPGPVRWDCMEAVMYRLIFVSMIQDQYPRICTFSSPGIVTCLSRKGHLIWQTDIEHGWRVDAPIDVMLR